MSPTLADELLLQILLPDRRAAARHYARLVAGGMALDHLVDDGLAPAMAEVGALWETDVWSVADEHVATAVVEAALSASAAESATSAARGDIVVACVEGDWHSLPSRMIAEVLVTQGWTVRFLGASTPTSLLVEHVARHRPQVVLLGCAVPMALPALAGAIQALHELGIPVYVGGRALGGSPRRATALGADGWAPDAAGAVALLDGTPAPLALVDGTRAPLNVVDVDADLADYRERAALLPAWVDDAMVELTRLMPAVAMFPPLVLERTAADLRHLLDTAAISLMLDDRDLLDEQCAWLRRVLDARGVPPRALEAGIAALIGSQPPAALAGAMATVLDRARQKVAPAATV